MNRNFTNDLTRYCLRDVEGNINDHSPKKYASIISEDEWRAFVAKRANNSFLIFISFLTNVYYPYPMYWYDYY